MITFVIDGSELSKAVTISFMPWFLEIILKGRSALKALNAFNDLSDSELDGDRISSSDAQTTKKSRMFHSSLKYGLIY